jgi:hypothetical protein
MRKTNLIIAVAAFTAVAASNLSAQSAPDRRGFYGDVAANYSIPNNELTDGTVTIKDTQGGLGVAVGAGFGLKNNRWLLGAQFDWMKTSDAFQDDFGPGADATLMFYTAAITFYPGATSNFWLRANLGYGTEKISGSGFTASGGGFAGGLAVGWDWMLGKGGFAVVPYLSYMDLFSTGDFDGDFAGEGITAKDGIFQVGVALGYKH